MRSKISTFESTPMPIVRMNPAMPGSVIDAPAYAIRPSSTIRLQIMADDGVDARELVVRQHEKDDEHEGRRAKRGHPTGSSRAPSVAPMSRSSR
jgi:hypothetical protein